MSEKLPYTPHSEISHASLDKDIYGMDISEEALLQGRADIAAAENVRREMIQDAYERGQREKDEKSLGDAAVRSYLRSERGLEPSDPTAAFRQEQAEQGKMARDLKDAGKVDMLNGAFANKLKEVKDETGTIDVDKLNPDDLVRYKSSLNVLLGEDAEGYDTRMESVFGTTDYISTVAKLIDQGDAWRLMNIAKRNPGANPLADKLLQYTESQQKPGE